MRQGKALVLIDGIDEVPETQRNRVREWIQGLVANFPARFLVTARPHAVEEGWLQQEQFEDAELQPMDLASIDNFVDHWHQAASETLQNDKEKAELPALAEHLKQEVKDQKTDPKSGDKSAALRHVVRPAPRQASADTN